MFVKQKLSASCRHFVRHVQSPSKAVVLLGVRSVVTTLLPDFRLHGIAPDSLLIDALLRHPARCHPTIPARFTPHGVLRLNCPAASTTVSAMKKSIILVSALSVVLMALVSCASDSNVDPARVNTDTTTPAYHEAAPAHDNIGGLGSSWR